MEQKIVGNMGKGIQGIGIVNGQRFAGPVPRGHDQNIRPLVQKQVVQRCIGQHNTKTRVVRGQIRSQTRALG